MFSTAYAAFRTITFAHTFQSINKGHCSLIIKKLIRNTGCFVFRKISYQNLFLTKSGFLITGCCFSKGTSRSESPLITDKNKKYSECLVGMDKSNPEEICSSVDSVSLKRGIDDENKVEAAQAEEFTSKRFKSSDRDYEKTSVLIPKELKTVIEEDVKCKLENKDVSDGKKQVKGKQNQMKQRPNYFVAVQISNAKIHDALKEVQDHILEQDRYLEPAMSSLPTLHVTLMVMYIGDQDTHQRALTALEQVKTKYDDQMSKEPLELEIKGLGNFGNKVLFAKITNDEAYSRLCNLADSVNRHFEAVSVPSTDSRKFNPHLTVAKITFDGKCRHIYKIKPALYYSYNDKYFGHQTVKSLQLLSMMKPKDVTGYYSGDEFFFSAFTSVPLSEHHRAIEEKKDEVKKAIQNITKHLV